MKKKNFLNFDPKNLKFKSVFCNIKKSHSNLFITLRDFKGNVFFNTTTGKMYPNKKNKKFKFNTTSSTLLGKEVGFFLKTFNVQKINVISNYGIKDSFIRNFLKGILSFDVRIERSFLFFKRAHNGCRNKKSKRK